MLSVRLSKEDKSRFEQFCEQTGMNVSVCVNMFVKAVLREQKLPFEVRVDPFCSEANMSELKRRVSDMRAGQNMSEHELIEGADD
ncbi:MAG: type II toxin-antitoxin system RelB/DinJ family antitoxin [Selenomonadaceae bacterium]|nr:type II toxin-antitoxin system RelB/DinJ family antitoxin [Selenomonadaceae bacterium]